MKKKAQLGKTLTTFFVLISLIVMMAIFILLASGISVFAPKVKTPETISPNENLLLKTISVKLNDNSEKQMLVIDAYLSLDKTNENEFSDKLASLLTPQTPCIVLAKGESENPATKTGVNAYDDFFIKLQEDKTIFKGNVGNTPLLSRDYESSLTTLTFQDKNGKNIYVESYYGACK